MLNTKTYSLTMKQTTKLKYGTIETKEKLVTQFYGSNDYKKWYLKLNSPISKHGTLIIYY